jgi:zinc protease
MTGPKRDGGSIAAILDRSKAPEPDPLRPSHFPEVERAELPNGIPLLFASTPGLPVVSISVMVEAGGVREPPDRGGLSVLASSLLESGAGNRDASAIAEEIERLGIQLGVGASWDLSHLDATGIRSRIPAAFDILRDLVREPSFPGDEVERLRAEQLGSILQRRAEPRGLANEMAARFIFSDESPYSRPLSGTTRTVGSLTRQEAAAFHATNFTPHGATVLVAGEIDLEEVLGLASERLGDWAGPAPTPILETVEPRSRELQIVIVDRPGSVQSEIRVGHVSVDRATPDYFPIMVMNAILGGAFSSRLNMNLRERHGFTYGVSSGFVMRRQPGPFLVSTAVQTEVTADALREILHELRTIRQEPVKNAELDDARAYLAGTFPLGLQTTSGVASRLAEIAAYGLPLDYFDHYRERVLSVNAESVLAAARERILPDSVAIVVVGDAGAVRTALEDLDLGPIQIINAKADE